MESDPALPPLTYHGHLPEGIHDTTLERIRERFVINPQRAQLWERLEEFLRRVMAMDQFSHAYIDGGFVTSKAAPEDIDVILQTRASYGPELFVAMAPFFAEGFDSIHKKYLVHLHFWSEGFPGGMSDFRRFFQYLRPQDAAPLGLKEGARKGIVRIKL
jgi:hypothetical protein